MDDLLVRVVPARRVFNRPSSVVLWSTVGTRSTTRTPSETAAKAAHGSVTCGHSSGLGMSLR